MPSVFAAARALGAAGVGVRPFHLISQRKGIYHHVLVSEGQEIHWAKS